MNAAHLHLITTHAPVMGSLFGLALLLLALLRKNEDFKRLTLLVFVASALVMLPAYLSGPHAHDQLLRSMPGLSRDASDQHAEIAIPALAGTLALGVVSLAGLILFRNRRSLPAGFLLLVLVLAAVTSAFLVWTANLGGRIRHLEIRPQTSAPPAGFPFRRDWHMSCSFPVLERPPRAGREKFPEPPGLPASLIGNHVA